MRFLFRDALTLPGNPAMIVCAKAVRALSSIAWKRRPAASIMSGA